MTGCEHHKEVPIMKLNNVHVDAGKMLKLYLSLTDVGYAGAFCVPERA